MLDIQHIRAIGEILDFTVGPDGSGRSGIAYSLQQNVLTIKFSTIVHFASERSLRDQTSVLADESIQKMKDVIKRLKSDFKDSTGDVLKTTELSNQDNLELIQATANSPRKIAYYRRFADLELDV